MYFLMDDGTYLELQGKITFTCALVAKHRKTPFRGQDLMNWREIEF